MYKTILVHVDGSAHAQNRVEVAARLALAQEAHLVGSALTGLAAYHLPLSPMDAGAPPVVVPTEELHAHADRALDRFEEWVRALGLASYERRRLDDDTETGLCLQARYADLLVVGQDARDVPYLVLNSARPVLVLPPAATGEVGRTVTVAWNGSAQAVRAITSAIALLRRAVRVHLLVLVNDDNGATHGEQPGGDMALYLARHGVKVDLEARRGTTDNGAELLSYATRTQSDLIVMGAFGRSRLREWVLGGVTRTALKRAPVALWMAH
ncbi:universal stress protein [Massilia sp. PAMC28688]|uniref:universal stress protein n=1 Tax=Massilia sp. PAMC28688 TaxID=2861283 RepID=UPI001C62DA62|nr:universal stress protein [Massilia sp. PAMC28688]QYF92984.1 universal stress protein [Massilia sp. PAMC28688]